MDDRHTKDSRRSFMAKTVAGGIAASLASGEALADGSHEDPVARFYDDFLSACRAADALPRAEGFLARDAAQTKYIDRLAERAKAQPHGADLVADTAGWLKAHPKTAPGDVVRVGEAEFLAAIGPSGALGLFPSFMNLTGAELRKLLPTPSAEGPRGEPLMGEGPIGPILATRPMLWRGADGVDRPAMIEIGKPYENPKPPGQREGAWCCRVRATGLGDDRYHTLFGGDSLEALGRALVQAGALASASPLTAASNWALEPRRGFPIIATMEDVAASEAQIQAVAAAAPREPDSAGKSSDEKLRRLGMDPLRDGMMGNGPIGQVAAAREMVWRRANGEETPVLIEIGVPAEIQMAPWRATGEWDCRHREKGMGHDTFFTMPGRDGVESLIMAIETSAITGRLPGAGDADWSSIPNNGFVMLPPERWEAAKAFAALEEQMNEPTT